MEINLHDLVNREFAVQGMLGSLRVTPAVPKNQRLHPW